MKTRIFGFPNIEKQKEIVAYQLIKSSPVTFELSCKKWLRRCSMMLVFTAFLLAGAGAHACVSNFQQLQVAQNVNFGNIAVPTNLPVGSVIKEINTTPTPGPSPTTCFGTMVVVPWNNGVINEFSFAMPMVYTTTIPGIGMKVTARNVGGKDLRMSTNDSATYADSAQTYYTVTLYKTGAVSAGTFPAGAAIGWVQVYGTTGAATIYASWLKIGAATTITPVTPTCDLSSSDVNRTVTLDTVQVKNIPTSNGKFGVKNFTISARCTGATTASFQFSGTPSSLDGTLFANTGTARGLGMHLASAYGDIPANGSATQRTVSVGVSGGTATLDMEAGYSRKSSVAVTAGTFASRATVTVSYQ